jgi:hypothetical protein
MSWRVPGVFAATVLFASVLGACGNSERSDTEQIRAVFAAYQEAAKTGDGNSLCRDILAPSQLGSEPLARCASGYERWFQSHEHEVDKLASTELGKITIDGDQATAENATDGGFFEFQREGERWGLVLVR